MKLILWICAASILHGPYPAGIASAGCIMALVQEVEQDEGKPVAPALLVECDWNMQGHPIVLGDLLLFLDSPLNSDAWQISIVTDTLALKRNGIEPDRIVIHEFHGVGACRRSALRLLLAKSGLGFVVHSGGTLVTLQHIADSNWTARTSPPKADELRHADVNIRREAAYSAGHWRLAPDVWLNPLLKSLNDDDRDVQFNAAFAVASFGADAAPAVGDLGKMLESADHALREVAAHTLTRIGRPALPELIRVAEGRDHHAARYAVNAIANMGINARSARPKLLAISASQKITKEQTNENYDRRRALAVALANMYVRSDIGFLKRMLSATQTEEREMAAQVVAEVGQAAIDCEPILQSMLSDPVVSVRRAAARALASLDLPSTTNTKPLQIASQDSDRHVALWASEALRKLSKKQDENKSREG